MCGIGLTVESRTREEGRKEEDFVFGRQVCDNALNAVVLFF